MYINSDRELLRAMEDKRGSKLKLILVGVMLIVMGGVAYITNLHPVGAVVLITVGMIGIIGGTVGSREKEQQH